MQVEKAFEALRERAEGNVLEAAQAQVQQRTEKLLDAVDIDKFVQGEPPELCLCLNWKVAPAFYLGLLFAMHSISGWMRGLTHSDTAAKGRLLRNALGQGRSCRMSRQQSSETQSRGGSHRTSGSLQMPRLLD